MSKYVDLKVWQKAHKLVLRIYPLTKRFPEEEKYGLASQLQRSACSIPINIAEGCGRSHTAELIQFLNIARGSTSEVEYELLLAKELVYISPEQYLSLVEDVDHIGAMLCSFMKSMKKKQSKKG